jgi:hypothetical protein
MASKYQVEQFLKDFKEKMKIWNVLFRDDRGKNAQTLAALEIRASDREKVLKELSAEDYCEGPLEDTLYKGPDMWVFGRIIKKKEVYIKITMGFPGSQALCISFHLAEKPMSYPLK